MRGIYAYVFIKNSCQFVGMWWFQGASTVVFFFTSALCINRRIRWCLRWYFHLVLFGQGPPCMIDFCDLSFCQVLKDCRDVWNNSVFSMFRGNQLQRKLVQRKLPIKFIKTANTLLIHAKILISQTTYNSYGSFVALMQLELINWWLE